MHWSFTGEWSFLEPGFTGIAIPSPSSIGTTHGVYVVDNAADIEEQYQIGMQLLTLNEH